MALAEVRENARFRFVIIDPPAVRVKPTTKLAETVTPRGEELVLLRHDGHYFLQAGEGGHVESSRASAVEEALARLACAPFRPVRQPRLLLGGLGLGFTLAAARAALPQKRASFVVVTHDTEIAAHMNRTLQLVDGRLEPQ